MKTKTGGFRPLYLVRVLQAYSDKAIGRIYLVNKQEYEKYKDHLDLIKIIRDVNELSIIK